MAKKKSFGAHATGKIDGSKVLSAASGIRKEVIREMFEECKANWKALDACHDHDFDKLPVDPDRSWDGKYRCNRCRGTVDASAYSWYEKGRLHGRLLESNEILKREGFIPEEKDDVRQTGNN